MPTCLVHPKLELFLSKIRVGTALLDGFASTDVFPKKKLAVRILTAKLVHVFQVLAVESSYYQHAMVDLLELYLKMQRSGRFQLPGGLQSPLQRILNLGATVMHKHMVKFSQCALHKSVQRTLRSHTSKTPPSK